MAAGAFVLAAAQGGKHENGRETYGDSMIVDFWGRILQRVPRGRGSAIAEGDSEAMTSATPW